MAILTVLTEPDSRLRKIAKPVAEVTPDICRLLNDMVETMHEYDGVGLAAPQVNVSKRIIVLECLKDDSSEEDPQYDLFKMINPVITKRSDEWICFKEGCLSVPDERVEVERYASITVEHIDEHGNNCVLDAENLLAVIIQHEIDHLDGKLIIDQLSPLKKQVALKRLKKRKNAEL